MRAEDLSHESRWHAAELGQVGDDGRAPALVSAEGVEEKPRERGEAAGRGGYGMRQSRQRARGVRWGGGVPVGEAEGDGSGGGGGGGGGGGVGSGGGGSEVGDEAAADGGAVRGRAAMAMVDRVPAAAVRRSGRG